MPPFPLFGVFVVSEALPGRDSRTTLVCPPHLFYLPAWPSPFPSLDSGETAHPTPVFTCTEHREIQAFTLSGLGVCSTHSSTSPGMGET